MKPGQSPSTRREQILDAAASLFARDGFHSVGIDDIGASVGISGPALYRHFRSKDGMLEELLSSISSALLAGAQSRTSTQEPPEKVLSDLVGFHVDFAITQPSLITVQERNLGYLGQSARTEVRSLQRQYVEIWVDAIQGAIPGVERTRARSAAHAVFGLLNSTPHNRYLAASERAMLLHKLALGALYAARPQ